MFRTVFNKLHEHSHTCIKITYNTFARYYYIPYLEKCLSIFIHDCVEGQRNRHLKIAINMKIQTAPHNHSQNMLHLSITAFQWTLKDLLILLHTTNHIYMSSLTLLGTFSLQYPSKQTTQKLQSKLSYTTGL